MYFCSLNLNSKQSRQIMLEFIWSLTLYLIEGQDNVLLWEENSTYQLDDYFKNKSIRIIKHLC